MVGMCTKVVWLPDLKEDWRSQPVNRERKKVGPFLSKTISSSLPPPWMVRWLRHSRKKEERKKEEKGLFLLRKSPLSSISTETLLFFPRIKTLRRVSRIVRSGKHKKYIWDLKNQRTRHIFLSTPIHPIGLAPILGEIVEEPSFRSRNLPPFPVCQEEAAASIPAPSPPSPYRNTSCMAHTSVAILRKCPTISFPNRKHWSKKKNFFPHPPRIGAAVLISPPREGS